MGLFSWITQDTNKSIPAAGSDRETFPVTMTDNKGNKWTEEDYEGYGEFGDKDYYDLLAEMNGYTKDNIPKSDKLTLRDVGICLESHAEGGDWGQKHYNINFDHIKKVKFPNLSEDENWAWRNEEPKSCEFQGYFYPEDEEDDENYGW